VATGSAASSSRLNSGRCKSLAISSKMIRRPLSFPTRNVTRLPFGKNGSGGFDIGRRNLENFRSGIDDEAEQFVSSSTTRMRFFCRC